MENKRKSLAPRLCMTALMAALVAALSQMQIILPSLLGNQRFHLGNAMCALSGLLLGPWWGGLASGMGSVFFDLFNPLYVAEAPITFFTKGAYGLVAGAVLHGLFVRVLGWKRESYPAQLIASLAAALAYIALYLGKQVAYNGLLLGGLTLDGALVGMAAKIPSALFNGAVAVAFAPVLGVALTKALRAAHLDRGLY